MVKDRIKLAVVFHPGRTLAEKLEEMGMGIKEFAVRTSKPEKTIIAVLKGDSSITPDMAVSFETVTMIPAHFWMNAQRMYDEYQARLKREQMIALSKEWMNKFPIVEMVRRGWIPECSTVEGKVNALFTFFGVSTEKAWEDYYMNQELKVAFRISLSQIKNPYAVSAWLRYGEIQASKVSLNTVYSGKRLREYLPLMRHIMANRPESFFQELQGLCSNIGIKLISVSSLPNVPIAGATRWINGIPVIQLSSGYERYDIFWFTFFHEIGHLLLHGKKDVFLEGIYWPDLEVDKEQHADKFADEMLLTGADEKRLAAHEDLSMETIIDWAESCGTHPFIVISRLLCKNILAESPTESFYNKVEI